MDISRRDYNRLIGVECSSELRHRLDAALHLCDYPTDERYAQLCPRFDGNCGARRDDGLCGLQVELGEGALPLICRLYPRAVHNGADFECCYSNSCEATIECFLEHSEPLSFIRVPLDFDLPAKMFQEGKEETAHCLHYISILQERSKELGTRMLILGKEVFGTFDEVGETEAGLVLVHSLLEQICEDSRSVHDFGQAALSWFDGGTLPERYDIACGKFEKVLPQWRTVFEHVLVNQMFFQHFPFHNANMEFEMSYTGLVLAYAILRFLTLGWCAEHHSIDDFVDASAATFRFIAHTSFDKYAFALLNGKGCLKGKLANLLAI